jgi:hypothetical protein
MRKLPASTALFLAGVMTVLPALADSDDARESHWDNTFTLAVYGDARQIDATPAFIAAVNRDRKVDLVLHAGDIHSGSTYCTLDYNQTIFDLWTQSKAPLVYTPGDNEWTDCQKPQEGGGVKDTAGAYADYADYAAGHPVANLALVRSMFFPEVGGTLEGLMEISAKTSIAWSTMLGAHNVDE